MGLLRRARDPEKELARAIGKRGVGARARIESVRPTGSTRHDGAARELEVALSFTTRDGVPVGTVARQYFNDVTAVGISAGEPAEIMYDRDEPQRAVILGSARYKLVDGQLVEVVDPRPG